MIVPCFLVAFLERQKRASLFCSPPRQRRVKAAACESVRLSFFTVPRPFFFAIFLVLAAVLDGMIRLPSMAPFYWKRYKRLFRDVCSASCRCKGTKNIFLKKRTWPTRLISTRFVLSRTRFVSALLPGLIGLRHQ